MNSIIKKILLVLAIVFGLYTAVLYSFVRLVITPSFNSLQQAAATEEVNRCRLIINKEIAITKGLCSDWATWDDSYAFMGNQNNEFIKSNLEFAGLKSSRTNTVIFIDNLGQIVWGKTYDLNTGQELHVSQFEAESIQKAKSLYSHSSIDSTKSGLLLVNGLPTVVAACPLVTSKKEGPIRGTLLMARFLNGDDIKQLATSLGTDFSIIPAEKAEFFPSSGTANSIKQNGGREWQICSTMDDIFGQPTMAIVAHVPAPIAARGRMVSLLVSFSVVVAGAITLLVTFLLLRAVVMRRIEKLAVSIEPLTGKEPVQGSSDELTRHAELVMKVVDRLDNTEHALDASYQRFWTAFFNAPVPVIIHNDDGKVMQVNRKWTALTGYNLADVQTVNELCQKVSSKSSRSLRNALEVTNQSADDSEDSEPVAIRTKEGRELIWALTSSHLGKTENGANQIISMAVDITESATSGHTHREGESLFRSLSEAIPAVTYMAELTADAFIAYISPRIEEMLGRVPNEIRNSAAPWRLIIAPEDYERVMLARFAAISYSRVYVGDYRATSVSGETLLLHEDARLIETARGPMIQGVIFDSAGSICFRPCGSGVRVP